APLPLEGSQPRIGRPGASAGRLDPSSGPPPRGLIIRAVTRSTKARAADANGGHPPTEVVGRYLEAIYYMEAEGETVRSARLADWLGVSRPTVTVALRRMSRDRMVRLTSRKEIELTDRGREAAGAIVRRHRIMERWLTDALG